MWDLMEKLTGYIALALVIGTILILLYLLTVVTFFIRSIIASDIESPKIHWQVHKWYWIVVGIVFLAGVLMFAAGIVPVVIGIIAIYLSVRYGLPLFVKKLFA